MCGNVECDEDKHMKIVDLLGQRRHVRDVVYRKRHRCGNMSSWTRHRFASLWPDEVGHDLGYECRVRCLGLDLMSCATCCRTGWDVE